MKVCTLTSVIAFVLALAGISAPAFAGSTPVVNPTATRAHAWGVDAYSAEDETVDQLQQKMHRSFASYAVYAQLDEGPDYPNWPAKKAIAARGMIYLNINSTHGPTSDRQPYCWSAIVNGDYDGLIDQWAHAITSVHYHRMVIGFQHEMSINNPMQPKCHTDTPELYGQAFHHLATRLRAHGVTAPFAWVPTASTFAYGTAESWEPPVDDFSIIGCDAYAGPANNWRDAGTLLRPFFAWQAQNAPGKAVMIGEIGATQTDARAPAWYADAMSLLAQHDNLVAVHWNANNTSGSKYSPLLNAKTLKAWTAAANNQFFG